MRPLTPAWIPGSTLDYIHRKHEPHITRQDLVDVIYRDPKNLSIRSTSNRQRSDLLVVGKSYSGKKLLLCTVIEEQKIKQIAEELQLQRDPHKFASLVYNAWEVEK